MRYVYQTAVPPSSTHTAPYFTERHQSGDLRAARGWGRLNAHERLRRRRDLNPRWPGAYPPGTGAVQGLWLQPLAYVADLKRSRVQAGAVSRFLGKANAGRCPPTSLP